VYSGWFHHHFDPWDFVALAGDGSHAIALSLYEPRGTARTVRVFDLHGGHQRDLKLREIGRDYLRIVTLLSSGRALFSSSNALEVVDLANGRRLCASEDPPPHPQRYSRPLAAETTSGRVSILFDASDGNDGCERSAEEQAVLVQLDPRTCAVERRSLCAPEGMKSSALALDGQEGLALTVAFDPIEAASRQLRIHDLETNATFPALILGAAPDDSYSTEVRAVFLANDLILTAWSERRGARAAVLEKTGELLGLWELPTAYASPMIALGPDRVLLALAKERWELASPFELDIFSGELRPFSLKLQIQPSMFPRASRLPDSMVVVDPETGKPMLLSSTGSATPIPLRWLL
jgi:hypothetical protein